MTPSLFVGFPAETLCTKSNPHLLKLMTSGGPYLQQVTYNQTLYLGKYASSPSSFEELSLLEANVSSLLRRLSPDFEKRPCLLTICSS